MLQASVGLALHEPVRLGREFWSCVLNVCGWIDVNSKFISLKLKLLLSQGAITAYIVPQIWGYCGGQRRAEQWHHFGTGP